jgi:hypothetical protein
VTAPTAPWVPHPRKWLTRRDGRHYVLTLLGETTHVRGNGKTVCRLPLDGEQDATKRTTDCAECRKAIGLRGGADPLVAIARQMLRGR